MAVTWRSKTIKIFLAGLGQGKNRKTFELPSGTGKQSNQISYRPRLLAATKRNSVPRNFTPTGRYFLSSMWRLTHGWNTPSHNNWMWGIGPMADKYPKIWLPGGIPQMESTQSYEVFGKQTHHTPRMWPIIARWRSANREIINQKVNDGQPYRENNHTQSRWQDP